MPLHAWTGSSRVYLEPDPCPIDRIHFVVPVYREWENGNALRLLENLGAQSDRVGISVVMVVNNSPEAARDPASPARAENQKFLEWAKGKTFSFSLHILDHSTTGIERNMGRIRQTGVDFLAERAGSESARHLVVHLDSDTRLPLDFADTLLSYYEKYRDLEAVFFTRDYDLRGTPAFEMLQTHHFFRAKRALLDFYNMRTRLSYGVATYQISSRLSALQRIGGVPLLPEDEDAALALNLRQSCRWVHAPDICLTTEDRERADGFTSRKRSLGLNRKSGLWGIFSGPNSPAALIRAEKKRRFGEFFLHHSLFAQIGLQLWQEVKERKVSYEEAVRELQERIQGIFGGNVECESRRFFGLSEEELHALPDDCRLRHRGYTINLSPVGHAFPDLILSPTNQPGSDLRALLFPHLGEREREELADGLARAEKEQNALASRRMEMVLSGEEIPEDPDVFLRRWKEEGFPAAMRSLPGRKRRELEALLPEAFPEWLAPMPASRYLFEAAQLQLITRLILGNQEEGKGCAKFADLLLDRRFKSPKS